MAWLLALAAIVVVWTVDDPRVAITILAVAVAIAGGWIQAHDRVADED